MAQSASRWFPRVLSVWCLLWTVGVLRGQTGGTEEVVIPADAPPQNPEAAPNIAAEDVAVKPEENGSASDQDPELERLRKEREKLSAENALASEQLRKDLFALEAEKQRLSLENSLRSERLDAEMAELRTKLDKTTMEIDAISRRAGLEAAQRREQLDRELSTLRSEEERLKLANSIANQKVEARLADMRLQEADFKIQKADLEMQVARLQTELSRREKAEVLHDMAPEEQRYSKEPFKDGVLLISDRRIALSGVIVQEMADHVAERIDYFNNQNVEYPIFLVIDFSPGGSLLAGEKILKAMQGSQAPVYVVVKSYAASMAATLVALAKHSFAYPNAILVHHQPSWLGGGNLTQQRENLEWAEQWWRRLAQPVATKMGLTLDQFIKRMYEKNSDGDWREFADAGRELKWVDDVVDTIWETSLDKNPDRFGSKPMLMLHLPEAIDEHGAPYVMLPRLAPLDYYFLYNPDGYYRLR